MTNQQPTLTSEERRRQREVRKNAERKERYRNDPEYRERIKAYNTSFIRYQRMQKKQKAGETGICMICKTEPIEVTENGPFSCKACRAEINRQRQALRNARREQNLCTYCGIEMPPGSTRRYCEEHTEQRKKLMQEKRENKICYSCSNKHDGTKTICDNCKPRINAVMRERHKLSVAAHKCSYCRTQLADDYPKKTCEVCLERQRNVYLERINAKKCLRCNKDNIEQEGKIHCNACLEKLRKNSSKVMARRTEQNLCAICTVSLDGIESRYSKNPICVPCYRKIRDYTTTRRQDRIQQGICVACGKQPPETSKKHCTDCLIAARKQATEYYHLHGASKRTMHRRQKRAQKNAG